MNEPADPLIDAAVLRVLAGDREAYADVVRRYGSWLRAWISRRCPPGIDEDEVAQRAFIRAYEVLASWTPGTAFRPWLAAIARNLLLEDCRRLRVREAHAKPLAEAWLAKAQEAEATAGTDGDEVQRLRTCIAALPPHLRELLEARYVREESIAAVASATRRSTGAIKKAMFLIRQRLLDCISRLAGGGAR